MKKETKSKYFVSWAPNPDPLYHAASKSPLGMPINPPLPNVAIPVDGYMISLDHLIGGRAKLRFRELAEKHGLHKVLRYKGPIMLDSGGYQKKERNPLEVLEFQAKFKPDFVTHMDVIGNVKKTVKNAEMVKQYEGSYDFKIYYVIQGRNVGDYIKCARMLLKLKCERFAIGNLARLSFLHKIGPIERVISSIRKEIGDKPLHLLGISDPKLVSNFGNIISSFDSATGIRNAVRLREVFSIVGNALIYYKKPTKRPTEFLCTCPVCKIFDVFENEYNYPKGNGERRRIRFLRAIHNTYIWWQATHMVTIKQAFVIKI
jgi:tRNA-guanine family transglycosylase